MIYATGSDINRSDEDEQELLLRELDSSTSRITEKSGLLYRESQRQTRMVEYISGRAESGTAELQLESEHVEEILNNRRNDCCLRLGIAANVLLLMYLLMTSL
jgi:hypothetical protein